MISPAFTGWPPNRFTPSRCAFESRPLRLDDAPFLCAIVSFPYAFEALADVFEMPVIRTCVYFCR